MAHNGPIFRLNFDAGWFGTLDLSKLPAGAISKNSRNVHLRNGGPEPRGGTAHVGSQVASGVASLGGGVLVKRGTGTIHRYFCGDDGKVYRDGTEIATGRSTTHRYTVTQAGDSVYICNGNDPMLEDDGSTASVVDSTTNGSSDWTGTTHPTVVVLHNKENSQRLFALGVNGKESTLYFSVGNTFDDFANAGSGSIDVDMQDGWGMINAVSKDGVLWLQGRKKTKYLLDTDSTPANWGSSPAAFEDGVHSPRHCIKIDNSVWCMNTRGDVYELQTATELRGIKKASITSPFFVHSYRQEEVNMAQIDQFHLGYDPRSECLKIFVARTGESTIDTSLNYYVDLGIWTAPHDSQDNSTDSGYSAACSYISYDSDERPYLETQDYDGWIWEIESTTKSDNGNAYVDITETGWLDFTLPTSEKLYINGELEYISRGDYQLDVQVSVDGSDSAISTVTLGSSGAALDSFVLDTDTLGEIGPDEGEFYIGNTGKRIKLKIEKDGAGEDYFISAVNFAFQDQGYQKQEVGHA